MQLGFVIDHSRCIGCHACTVACKSENDVPLGDFRTWVKYTEVGTFPEVKRSFAVLRCNQCTEAPCVAICPVTALDKRPDGIVDVDGDICIGCKACMQGCPYDALYLNEAKGTAEKCHFCAHRVERGLAPACAVVCPTEAIIPGDFHDPASRVSQMRDSYALTARKTEAGTGPNVLYREVSPAGVDPGLTNGAGGYLWSNPRTGPVAAAETFLALEAELEHKATARTVYDVNRKPLWGSAISGYLFFKSLAAGAFLAGARLLPPFAGRGVGAATQGVGQGGVDVGQGGGAAAPGLDEAADLAAGAAELASEGFSAALAVPALALLFLGVTMVLLVADLKRPERFLSILLRPNWDSWLAKGSFILMAYGLLLTLWLGLGILDAAPGGAVAFALVLLTGLAAALSAAYTGWLFAQSKGRVLWMRRGLWFDLVVQAVIAGAALLLLAAPLLALDEPVLASLRTTLAGALAVHLAGVLLEGRRAPLGREAEYRRASHLLTRGPYARVHWALGVVTGTVLPLVLALVGLPGLDLLAGALALVGLWFLEDGLVRAGQALPIS